MNIQPYLTEPPLYLGYMPGRSSLLVLAFTGVGLPKNKVPQPEAVRLTGWDGENHVLFITDASRSWMNGPGLVETLQAAVARLIEQIKPSRIVAFGISMGGTSALIYAGLERVDTVLAIVPQYSVKPDLVPEERRWRIYRDLVTEWRFPAVPDLSGRDCDVMILHGGEPREIIHARRFAPGPRIDHYVIPQHGHLLARDLKDSGHLQPLMTHVLKGDMARARAAVESAGGLRFAELRRRWREARRARRQAKAEAAAAALASESGAI